VYINFQKIISLIFIIFNSLIINNLYAQKRFDFTPLARAAYDKTLALRFTEAKAQLELMRKNDPDNLIVHYIENHIECLEVFITEEKSNFNRLVPRKDIHLEALKKGDPKSPYYLFTQAQVRLFWAMNRAKFGEYLEALNEASSAFEMLEKNQKKYPQFVPNKMTLGILHAVVGTIPDNIKWGAKLVLGMNGTIQQGQAEIEEVINYAKQHDYIFEQEALTMYAFLMLHLNNQNENAWTIVNNGKLKPAESLLGTFALANVAMRTGRCDKAIDILQHRPNGANYFPMHYLDYMLGSAKLYRGDSDSDGYFKKYAQNFKGRNYLKEVYQRLAWIELLKGNTAGYKMLIEKCKTNGRADIGNDKNALKEAKNGIIPEPTLLRGRLFFDGGYYQKAYDLLKNKQITDFKNPEHQLEYPYRMGRIAQMMKKTIEAIQYYDKTMQTGKNSKLYYACAAALQMGLIYEETKNYTKAKEYYNFCLKLNPDDYADSFHARAKAGLNRLNKY
jgi:tetratricopeptide (TPR) repeat protein